jgi:hypothetical protein
MQVTAEEAGTRDDAAAGTQERRPVRILVPTRRRSERWLDEKDTLRASDLGITRDTTDEELLELVPMAEQIDVFRDDPLSHIRRLRNTLRTPRDIAEARAWGYEVPFDENEEEFDPRPRKRLGWWWVYHPSHTETRDEREARYLDDERLIDMKGWARVSLRSYITVKDLKGLGDRARRIVEDIDGYRTNAVETMREINPGGDADEYEREMLAEAREILLKAMPERLDRYGQSDVWTVRQAVAHTRHTKRVNEWYEYNKIKQTGRPRGSRTRPRSSTS